MRSRRTLPVRLASLGGAVALAATGLAGTVGLALAGSGGIAGADTPTFVANCTTPIGAASIPTSVTATISPSPVAPGGSFHLTNFAVKAQIPASLATLIPAGTVITGTVQLDVTASGATPGSQTATFNLPTITVPSGQTGPINFTAQAAATLNFVAGTSGANVVLSTGTTSTLNTSLNGAAPITSTCTQPVEQLATSASHEPPGVLQALLPNAGPSAGGNTIRIVGDFLANPTGVNFGGVKATSFISVTPNSISAVVPAGTAGNAVQVQVTTGSGPSSTESYTYTDGPIVTGMSPSTGPPAGGTSVTITGTGFTGATVVDFGTTAAHAIAASHITVNSDTSITATAPPGTGVVNVTVTVPGANLPTSPTGVQNRFSYRAGYWLGAADGGVFTYGNPPFEGSAGNLTLNEPVVGMAATPDGGGYWLVASDGGVFAYGDANFYGSTGGLTLNSPVVGIAATPDGFGYWLVAADGGTFAFGDAQFFGSMGGTPLNAPVAGMASTPDGNGYWLVAQDGGVFAFGDAAFEGSAGNLTLVAPVVGITAAPGGNGYWLAAADGGVFNYGPGAAFLGSAGDLTLNAPVVSIAASPDGNGYWLAAGDGGVFSYPDAVFWGSAGGLTLNAPMVGMAAVT